MAKYMSGSRVSSERNGRGKITTLALTAALSLIVGIACQSAVAADKAETSINSTDSTTPKEQTTAESTKVLDDAVHEHHATSSKIGKVSCTNAHAACQESEKVIETLKHMSHLYTDGKFDEFAQYMDDGCTTFDEKRNKLIVGKQAVIEDIRTRWTAAHSSGSPIVSFSINHPYAQVTGDQAVVTFEAVKTIGGKNPETMVSRCTDIFVKKDGTWKKLHYRSCWKKGKPTAGT